MNEEYKIISRKFFPTLKYKNIIHKPLIIAFFGIPGSGKTHIAKLLENKYKAVRINSNYIEDIIFKNKIIKNSNNIGKIKNNYIYHLISKIPFQNKRIILDKSIDREYSRFLKVCYVKNIPYFLIRMEIKKRKAIKRIKIRNPKYNVENLSEDMKKWYKDWKYAKKIKSDITLNGENLDLKKLYKKLIFGIPCTN